MNITTTYQSELDELGKTIGYGLKANVLSNFLNGGCGVFAIALSRVFTKLGIPHGIKHLVHYYGEIDDAEVNMKPLSQKNNLVMKPPYDIVKHISEVKNNIVNVGHIFLSAGGLDYDIRGPFKMGPHTARFKIEECGIITLNSISELRKLTKYTSFYEGATDSELQDLAKLESDLYDFLLPRISVIGTM